MGVKNHDTDIEDVPSTNNKVQDDGIIGTWVA
jgi:hypothetical protein